VSRLGLGAVAILVALAAGCAPVAADPSAPYFPATRPAAATAPPVDPGATLPTTRAVAASGPVARPNPALTPGVVATTDAAAVCQQPKRVRTPVPYAEQQALLAAYGIPAQDAHRYGLDYLVPLQLGGAAVSANLWPAATKGVGYHEKQQLNARLRTLVCRGEVALAAAQHDIAADWYTEWLRYGA
jgi:hypothetical protein